MLPLPVSDRHDSVVTLTADPPSVHDGAPGGVWGTSVSCYRFIADHLPEDAHTLETGLGLSTLMFSAWSRSHVCVVGSATQVDALRAHCQERELSLENVRFAVGSSDEVLPTLPLEPVDLFLIDGGHGYPIPVIDWFYGARALRDGGIVVIDDVQLPSVRDYLTKFLHLDPRWTPVGGDGKWKAFRKVGDFALQEEWTEQAFLGERRLPPVTRLKVAVHRGMTTLRSSSRSSTP